MISISTLSYDLNGSVVIETDLDFRENIARVSRAKLLDGSVYINHSGVSDGDRTFRISEVIDQAQADILWYIFNNYTIVSISCSDGFFLGAIQNLKINNGDMAMTVLVKSKEA